jgi:hypothetical protein
MKRFPKALQAMLLGALVAGAGSGLWAANLPSQVQQGSCSEPSQILSCSNSLTQVVNAGLGMLAATGTAFLTAAGTAEQTAVTTTLPGNIMVQAGNSIRQRCWGGAANNGNVKTVKLYFGSSIGTLSVTASAATNWEFEALTVATSPTAQTTEFRALQNNTSAPIAITNVTSADTPLAGTVILKCTLTDGTNSVGDLSMSGYLAEIIK